MNHLHTPALQAAREVMEAYNDSPASVDAQNIRAAMQILGFADSLDLETLIAESAGKIAT